MRREPAVAASSNANNRRDSNQSKSNSRSRAQEYAAKLAEERRNKPIRQRSTSTGGPSAPPRNSNAPTTNSRLGNTNTS